MISQQNIHPEMVDIFKDKTRVSNDVTEGHKSPTEIFKPGHMVNGLLKMKY